MKKLIIFVLAIFFANNAFADDATKKNVSIFIDNLGDKIISIASEKGSEEIKKNKIIAEIDKVIDADWLARFVLGKNYKTATETQREKFTKTYRQFMINTYGPKFKNYNGKAFNVLEVDERNGFYVAKCEFIPRDGSAAVNVDFRVKERDGKLLVLDFIAEGISLIETQRSEFNSAISQKGMDKFLEDLQNRVNELKKQK